MIKSILVKCMTLSTVIVGFGFADVIHETTKWQSIGKETIADVGSSDNGVFWSLNNGASWSLLSDNSEFTVGQTVDFKVEIWKEFQGTHLSDVAKVWIDGVEEAKGEWALKNNGFKKKVGGSNYSYFDGNVKDGSQTAGIGVPKLLANLLFEYTFSEARDYELVARTMCSDDLSKLNKKDGSKTTKITYINDKNKQVSKKARMASSKDWDAFTTTNPEKTLQGEVEMYTFSVVNDVPEPATLSLLGIGLLSIAFLRRKKR